MVNPNDETKTVDQLRLKYLEKTQGIEWFVWGYEIPAGQKRVFHFSSGSPGQNHPLKTDATFEITGPLSTSLKNRIALIKTLEPIPNGPTKIEQFDLEISTEKQTTGNTFSGAIVPQLEQGVGAGWSIGGPGDLVIGGHVIPIYSAHRTPEGKLDSYVCSLDVSVLPADPGSAPGTIIRK